VNHTDTSQLYSVADFNISEQLASSMTPEVKTLIQYAQHAIKTHNVYPHTTSGEGAMCALYALAGAIASFGAPTKFPIAYANHQRLIYDQLYEHLLSPDFEFLRQKIAADSAMQGAALDHFMSLESLQFDAVALLFKEVGRVYNVPTNIVLLICDKDGAITGASSEGDLEISSNVAFSYCARTATLVTMSI
jgi:hypothetical protein